nr:hypothetical protein [Tanacetum cinerariifolium]
NGRKPDISFLHVFGGLCYPKNDREDIRKRGAKGDIGFFIGTKNIMETMNVSFDELSAMAFEQRSSKPGLQSMTSGQISSGLNLTYAPSTITTQQPSEVTSNSVSTPQESKGVNNDKVITPGMFRINPFKTSREEKHVPIIVRASTGTKAITVS